jgi:glycosyltransferase involved in cell wall biosynthesis
VQALLLTGAFTCFALACRIAPDGDRDGLPVALLEAQAAGVPVVSSALPGFEAALDEPRGAVLLPLTEEGGRAPAIAALASALRRLHAEPTRRDALAQAAREAALRRPSPEDVGRELLRKLVAALSEPEPAGDRVAVL